MWPFLSSRMLSSIPNTLLSSFPNKLKPSVSIPNTVLTPLFQFLVPSFPFIVILLCSCKQYQFQTSFC